MRREEEGADAITVELHDRFWKRLVLFASRRVSDSSSAEDIAQETLRRVFEALRDHRVENLDALPGFVFQTARNICMHHGRSARRERTAMQRFSSGAATMTEGSAVGDLVASERAQALDRAIAELQDADRNLLRLLFVDGLDTQTVALRLQIDAGTLRVRKHRLLKRLSDIVGARSGNEWPPSGTKD